jgi:transposase
VVIDAILWVLCAGNSWRSLPAHYGKWTTASSRYHRWLLAGIWDQVLAKLDASSCARPRGLSLRSHRTHLAESTRFPAGREAGHLRQ